MKLMTKPDGLDENILIEYYNYKLEKDYQNSDFSEEQKEKYKCPHIIDIVEVIYDNVSMIVNFELEDNKQRMVTILYENIYPFMVNLDRFKKLDNILNDNQ